MCADPPAREIHIAVAEPAAEELVADLRSRIPREIRLQAHRVAHSWTDLQALHLAAGDYLTQKGWRTLYSVDGGAQVNTNDVRIRLTDTAPEEALDDNRTAFPDAPLRIELDRLLTLRAQKNRSQRPSPTRRIGRRLDA